jgi:hypothetical protein
LSVSGFALKKIYKNVPASPFFMCGRRNAQMPLAGNK